MNPLECRSPEKAEREESSRILSVAIGQTVFLQSIPKRSEQTQASRSGRLPAKVRTPNEIVWLDAVIPQRHNGNPLAASGRAQSDLRRSAVEIIRSRIGIQIKTN